MKVLLLNGSPHAKGCTYTALTTVSAALQENGIETELFQIGTKPIRGCIGCGKCAGKTRCIFDDDIVNTFIETAGEFDGFIFGAPVHYAGAAGAVHCMLDRAFYAGGKNFAYKPGAAVVSARRAGTTAALDILNKYFTINNMPLVSSCYWNMVHGSCAEDVAQDIEGVQIMRRLGQNMAWLLKCIETGKNAGIVPAPSEPRTFTNFIR